jgi:hypothetical protein
MMTGILIGSSIISAIFMVALMYLEINNNSIILFSSAIYAISLFGLGIQLWLG